jgi:hypothetical protein
LKDFTQGGLLVEIYTEPWHKNKFTAVSGQPALNSWIKEGLSGDLQ